MKLTYLSPGGERAPRYLIRSAGPGSFAAEHLWGGGVAPGGTVIANRGNTTVGAARRRSRGLGGAHRRAVTFSYGNTVAAATRQRGREIR